MAQLGGKPSPAAGARQFCQLDTKQGWRRIPEKCQTQSTTATTLPSHREWTQAYFQLRIQGQCMLLHPYQDQGVGDKPGVLLPTKSEKISWIRMKMPYEELWPCLSKPRSNDGQSAKNASDENSTTASKQVIQRIS
jgi:hypothetical protein